MSGADLTQEPVILVWQHGQRKEVEVEGLRLIVAAIPAKARKPELADQEVPCAFSQLQRTDDKCLISDPPRTQNQQ